MAVLDRLRRRMLVFLWLERGPRSLTRVGGKVPQWLKDFPMSPNRGQDVTLEASSWLTLHEQASPVWDLLFLG